MPWILQLAEGEEPVEAVEHRIHVQRLGRRIAVLSPATHTPAEAVAIMTGAQDVASDKSVS